MLGVYMGICAANGMVWSTFSSISTHATEYYDTSLDFINWFEMCFFISYFPPAPFVRYSIGIVDDGKTSSLEHVGLHFHDFFRMLD